MEFYTTEFNNLNHTNYQMKDLFCYICKNLLTTRIYTNPVVVGKSQDNVENVGSSEYANICGTCYRKDPNADENNKYIENLYLSGTLKHAKFLCLKLKCLFQGTVSEYNQHLTVCMYQTMQCQFDNEQFEDITELVKHLPKHKNVSEISMDGLHIAIEFPNMEEDQMFVATLNYHTFIIVALRREDDTLTLEVGHMSLHFASSINKFTVVYQVGNVQMRQLGEIQQLHEMLKNAGADDRPKLVLNSMLLKGGKITIYINMDCMDIYKNKVGECPVCFNQFGKTVRQCVNGHSLCPSCAAKVTTCPLCRKKITSTECNLQNILVGNEDKCENFEDGCLESENLAAHRPYCLFVKSPCPQCKASVYAYQYYNHFVAAHDAHENFSFLNIDIHTGKPCDTVFIRYRASIYSVKIIFEKNWNLKFSMQEHPKMPNIQNQFKVIIYNDDQEALAEVGCDCSGTIVSVDLSSFIPKVYVQNGCHYIGTIICQFKILCKPGSATRHLSVVSSLMANDNNDEGAIEDEWAMEDEEETMEDEEEAIEDEWAIENVDDIDNDSDDLLDDSEESSASHY